MLEELFSIACLDLTCYFVALLSEALIERALGKTA
jgi:hypothetical protein